MKEYNEKKGVLHRYQIYFNRRHYLKWVDTRQGYAMKYKFFGNYLLSSK